MPRALSLALTARLYRFLRRRWGGLEALTGHFPREGLLLDLGCGEGILALLLVRGAPGRRVVAVDAHEPRVARVRASARGLPVEAICARLESHPLPRCQGIALVDVLHYFAADVQEALLDRAAAALAPGGVLVLRDPDAGAGLRFRLNRLHEALFLTLGWTRGGRGRYRTGAEWCDLLEARGLRAAAEPLRRLSPYADRVVVARKP
jgi:SAM-dependent methyltransferase